MSSWALQDAKARFSAVVDKAHSEGPQWVTRRGENAVVVIDAAQFQQMTRRQSGQDLVGFFRASPLVELPADWSRREDDSGREVPL